MTNILPMSGFSFESTVARDEVTVRGEGNVCFTWELTVPDSVLFATKKYTFVKLGDMGVYCQSGAAEKNDMDITWEPFSTSSLWVSLHHSFLETVRRQGHSKLNYRGWTVAGSFFFLFFLGILCIYCVSLRFVFALVLLGNQSTNRL